MSAKWVVIVIFSLVGASLLGVSIEFLSYQGPKTTFVPTDEINLDSSNQSNANLTHPNFSDIANLSSKSFTDTTNKETNSLSLERDQIPAESITSSNTTPFKAEPITSSLTHN